MEASEVLEPLPLPDVDAWSSVGLSCGPEIRTGSQSRTFHSAVDGEPIVLKLSDSRLVDDSFERRVQVWASVAETSESVVGPVRICSRLVTLLDRWLVVAHPTAVGTAPNITDASDVGRMASTLASLHGSLARLGPVDLPPVAALRGAPTAEAPDGFGPPQLLHGDYSDANMLFAGDQVRVFDFDDCGYGPVEFEIGNTLYMVLFDASMSSDMQRYERFRGWFVDAYRASSGRALTDGAVDSAIKLRVDALGRWVDQPDDAPIGIRTATPEWRDRLRLFVESTTAR